MAFRVLDRYVYREMLPIFGIAVGVFTFLNVMDHLQEFSSMLVSGASLLLVLRLWFLVIVSYLTHTLPIGLLLAVVIAAGRLASDYEVVAFGASGVSPLRLFRPFLIAAVVVMLMIAALTLWINPWGNTEFYNNLALLRRHIAAPMLQERTFTKFGNLVVYVDQMDLSTAELRGVLVADEGNDEKLGIVTAPRGFMIDDVERHRTILRLTDGVAHESRRGSPDWYRVTKFDVLDTPLDVTSALAEVEKEAGARQKKQTTWDLVVNTRALEYGGTAKNAESFILEFHKRLAFPLAPIVFAMVAFPLGIRLQRGGRAVAAVGGIAVYLGHNISQEGLSRIAWLRTWGGGQWVSIILFALLGIVLLYWTVVPAPRAFRRGVGRFLALLPARWSPFGSVPAVVRRLGTWRRRHALFLVDRYLTRQFLIYIGYGLTVAAAIFVVVDLLETLSRYRPPLGAILEHFAYRLPSALHQALPIVVLVASVFLFMELGRHHELTALKAAGISIHRISLPVLVLAGVVSVGAFVFQETAAPVLNAKGDEVDRVAIRKTSASGSQPQLHWYRRSDSEFARVERLDRARRQASDVTLVQTDRNFRMVKRLDAAHAVWTPNGLEIGQSVLREFGRDNAVRTEWQKGTPVYLADSLDALGAMPPPSAMTFMELRTYVRYLRERGQAVGTAALFLHTKLSAPLLSLVLATLAITCTCAKPGQRGGGRLIGAAIAVGIAIAYFVVNSGALSLGRAGFLPPIVAAWAANIVFGGIAVSLFIRTPT